MFMYIVTFISFLLDIFLSSIIPIINTSIIPLIPMFTIVSLVLMYPYFNNNQSGFLKYTIIVGLLYDITITNTLCVNAIIFGFLSFLIYMLDSVISNNLLSIIIKSILIIILYDIIMYLILVLIGYINFNFLVLPIKILKSIILNVIYIIVTYNITDRIAKKLRIKKLI